MLLLLLLLLRNDGAFVVLEKEELGVGAGVAVSPFGFAKGCIVGTEMFVVVFVGLLDL